MTLPSAYLTSTKNTSDILRAMQAAQAPDRFTIKFLEGLGYAGSNDRAMVNVLKALGMLNDSGVPTRRYHEYLDQTRSEVVLAHAIREAYSDLFKVNKAANLMSSTDVRNKMKTLSEGAYTDRVLTQMAATFAALVKNADFSAVEQQTAPDEVDTVENLEEVASPGAPIERERKRGRVVGDLVYNINIHLPESRDPAVYDALFKSLKEHLG